MRQRLPVLLPTFKCEVSTTSEKAIQTRFLNRQTVGNSSSAAQQRKACRDAMGRRRINTGSALSGRGPKKGHFTSENRLFRGCAPGVTRTPDRRIRNPLLYPAELRAQLRSEVAASECDVQVFPGSVR